MTKDEYFDQEYTWGRPTVYLSTLERVRLDSYRSQLHDRIPNGLPYMVEFEECRPMEDYPE